MVDHKAGLHVWMSASRPIYVQSDGGIVHSYIPVSGTIDRIHWPSEDCATSGHIVFDYRRCPACGPEDRIDAAQDRGGRNRCQHEPYGYSWHVLPDGKTERPGLYLTEAEAQLVCDRMIQMDIDECGGARVIYRKREEVG